MEGALSRMGQSYNSIKGSKKLVLKIACGLVNNHKVIL